jgi:hypothetical protein
LQWTILKQGGRLGNGVDIGGGFSGVTIAAEVIGAAGVDTYQDDITDGPGG